jgi:prevent-host-death family protein
MQAINYTFARNNLKSIIDSVCDNNEEVIVTTKNDKTVVIMSLDEYNSTHASLKKDAIEAKKQIERNEFCSIDEAFEKAKSSYRA